MGQWIRADWALDCRIVISMKSVGRMGALGVRHEWVDGSLDEG